MKSKTIYIYTAVFLVFIAGIFSNQIYSQHKPAPPPLEILYSNSNGNVNSPGLSHIQPEPKLKSKELADLEKQLDAARLAGNNIAAATIQNRIDVLLGSQPVYHPALNSSIIDGNGYTYSENDYNQSPIHTWSIYSHAFGVAPANSNVAGRLFYLLSQDSQTGSDTIKLMHSSNNGVSWSAVFWMALGGYTFNKDEMDIEVVYDGTNTWIYGVAGVTDQGDGRKKIMFLRRNAVTGTDYYWTILNFPGSGAGMNYYNPRITSDNATFTSNAYIMMICSMDSAAGSNHFIKQKYMYSSTPFAPTPGFNYAQPNGTNGFFWSTSGGTNSGLYLYGDIAYYKDDGGTGENRIMTVYNCYNSGFNNIYIAYLNGYSTSGSSMTVTEPNVTKDLRIAFNGGSNNRYGMITYVRQFNSSDWDIFGLKTSTGGNNAGAWVRDTIDYTGDRARTVDLIAVRNTPNHFRLCYAQDNPSVTAGFYRTYTGSSWSSKFLMTSTAPDTIWAEPKAGYILGGGDDGIGIWSLMGGYNGYCSKNMTSTTGIINNQVPEQFSLSQNYPNPFNPVTKIRFALPSQVYVKLTVYDVSGRQVSQLVNSSLPAGTHEYSFDAAGISSGVYFYRLEAKGFTEVKKMMLIK